MTSVPSGMTVRSTSAPLGARKSRPRLAAHVFVGTWSHCFRNQPVLRNMVNHAVIDTEPFRGHHLSQHRPEFENARRALPNVRKCNGNVVRNLKQLLVGQLKQPRTSHRDVSVDRCRPCWVCVNQDSILCCHVTRK